MLLMTVPHGDFLAGFEVGFQMIRGSSAKAPNAGEAPVTPVGSTPFIEGIKAGIVAARYKLAKA